MIEEEGVDEVNERNIANDYAGAKFVEEKKE